MVDFRGQANNSGVHTFTLNPKGAGFELAHPERFIWSVLATDIDFGVDGGLYVLDWVQGWNVTGKGRIYRVFDPGLAGDPAIAETKQLLREGMANRSSRELGRLLGSQDYRVRLDAQFELVRRGEDGLREFTRAARQTLEHTASLHVVWGLGQVLHQFRGQVITFSARRNTVATLVALLDDASEQVRAQSARVLGDARAGEALAGLIKLAADADATVRFHAVMGLGKLNQLSALPAIRGMLRENHDADPLLRHAGVMALTAFRDRDTLNTLARDASPAVRMASLLAMRRLKYDDIGQFLNDADSRIVREAARAINDAPVNGATLALAGHEPRDWNDAVVVGRWVNANLRAGNAQHARKLAALGANPGMPEPARQDALLALGDWGNPSGRDRVTGNWRPLLVSSRDGVVPANALKPHVAGLFSDQSQGVQLATIEAVAKLQITEASSALAALVRNREAAEVVRVAALNALETLPSGELAAALEAATASGQERLAGAASAIRARTGLGDALAQIQADLKEGGITARQSAIRSLADVKSAAADELLLSLLQDLSAEKLPPALGVDILDVAAARGQEAFTELVKAIDTGDGSPLAPYRFTLVGGDAETGRKIFFEREDVACLRCHQSGLEAGGEVGPKLEGLATRVTPEYILESIVYPNAHIAPGFENLMVETKTGAWVAGLIQSEDNENLVINSPEDGLVTIPVADVKTRQRGASGMPDGMGQILSRQNLRDLLAYLSTLK